MYVTRDFHCEPSIRNLWILRKYLNFFMFLYGANLWHRKIPLLSIVKEFGVPVKNPWYSFSCDYLAIRGIALHLVLAITLLHFPIVWKWQWILIHVQGFILTPKYLFLSHSHRENDVNNKWASIIFNAAIQNHTVAFPIEPGTSHAACIKNSPNILIGFMQRCCWCHSPMSSLSHPNDIPVSLPWCSQTSKSHSKVIWPPISSNQNAGNS